MNMEMNTGMDSLIGRDYEQKEKRRSPMLDTDTDGIKDIISHAALNKVKCLDIKGIGLFVEFFDGPDREKEKEEPQPDTDEQDEAGETINGRPHKEYLGAGIVSKEDSETLMNPMWKE